MNKLRLAAWAGIISLVLLMFTFVPANPVLSIFLQFAGAVTTILFMYGFVVLADAEQNPRLRKASRVLIIVTIVTFLATALGANAAFEFKELAVVVESVPGFLLAIFQLFAVGIATLYFGRALLSLKSYGRLARWTGTLEIIGGVCSILLGLALFSYLLRSDAFLAILPGLALKRLAAGIGLVTVLHGILLHAFSALLASLALAIATVLQIIILFRAART